MRNEIIIFSIKEGSALWLLLLETKHIVQYSTDLNDASRESEANVSATVLQAKVENNTKKTGATSTEQDY